jgi:hypothetical protein
MKSIGLIDRFYLSKKPAVHAGNSRGRRKGLGLRLSRVASLKTLIPVSQAQ